MSRVKITLIISLLFIAAIQFIPVTKNTDNRILVTDISKIYPVPVKIQAVLKNTCYDCHSNRTFYPWYASLQPVSWWIASHIIKGKEKLNFSDFGSYSNRRQHSKLEAMANSINDGVMPIGAYTLIHQKARLIEADRILLNNWIEKTKDSLSFTNK
ncbi:heme-binding domain-containing protein [Pedobacter cryoconitis]|uniref:Haem-binding domain-containing protein n=1 Tax=Pedobacter cryoconitis TaxID=188932 RepID=A0A7X0MGR1_9SPHI|nr:heme-binding domain-containing protein [Pedobacter cryoconitis]MBB6498046.1 hypothetical protein [Pedobacter cryoconitis]